MFQQTEEEGGAGGAAGAAAAWGGVVRGWAAGAALLALLVVIARLAEYFLDWKYLLRTYFRTPCHPACPQIRRELTITIFRINEVISSNFSPWLKVLVLINSG